MHPEGEYGKEEGEPFRINELAPYVSGMSPKGIEGFHEGWDVQRVVHLKSEKDQIVRSGARLQKWPKPSRDARTHSTRSS